MNEADTPEEQVTDSGYVADPATLDSDLDNIVEALLLASEQPLSLDALQRLLAEDGTVDRKTLRASLARLGERLEGSAMRLEEVSSGWRVAVRDDYAPWVHRLWAEKPPKLSRALLETLAIICYRQPVTRSDIEDIRGVTVSSNILRTLVERGWVREAGVKEVPGRPALLVTTPQLLDDLGLKALDDLPSLPEIKDPEQLEAALQRLAEKRGITLGPPPEPAGDAPDRDDAGITDAALDPDADAVDASAASAQDAADESAAPPDPADDAPPPERMH